MRRISSGSAFTLIELLLVIAVIVALAVTVFVALNPAQRLAAARDTGRLNDIASFASAMTLYQNDAAFAGQAPSLGNAGTIYVSIPDPTATTTAGTNCAGLGFPTTGYHCPASSTYRNTDGTGWIPVNFNSVSTHSLLQLPVDPTNTSSSGEYYEYATDSSGNWEIIATPEATANRSNTNSFALGTNKSLIVASPGDTTPPSVTITAPAAGSTTPSNNDTTVTTNATDNVGVARVDFYYSYCSGTFILFASTTTPPYTVVLRASLLNAGSGSGAYTLKAIAYDAAGNSSTSATVNFRYISNMCAP